MKSINPNTYCAGSYFQSFAPNGRFAAELKSLRAKIQMGLKTKALAILFQIFMKIAFTQPKTLILTHKKEKT